MIRQPCMLKSGFTLMVTGHALCSHFGITISAWVRIGGITVTGLASVLSAQALILYGSGDPTHNTTAPTGSLAGSGWQWQGIWGGLLGTSIAPGYFITVAHVGGGTGQMFYVNGRNYVAVASYLAPNADLRIWQVADTFDSFAPRYTGTAERSKGIVFFGRGFPRGDAVVASGIFGPETKGWYWGSGDPTTRWGTNTVATITDTNGNSEPNGAALPGDLLRCTFDANAGTDEGTLSSGDSGGGAFVLDAGVWKLVGLNHAVESDYRFSANGPDFSAAIYDRGGLYNDTSAGWVLVPDEPVNLPAAFYTTRLTGNESWIASVLAGQVTAERIMGVESAASPEGPYAAEPSAQLQAAASQFVVPLANTARFYRLSSDYAVNVKSVTRSGSNIVLHFSP